MRYHAIANNYIFKEMDEMSSVRLFEATNARVKKSAAMVDEIFCREYKGSSYDNRSVDDFYATLRSDKTSLSDLADVQDTLQQYHQRISASVKGNKQMIDTFKVTDRESEKLMAFTKEL